MCFSIILSIDQPRTLRMTATEEPYLHLKTILAALFCAFCSLLTSLDDAFHKEVAQGSCPVVFHSLTHEGKKINH